MLELKDLSITSNWTLPKKSFQQWKQKSILQISFWERTKDSTILLRLYHKGTRVTLSIQWFISLALQICMGTIKDDFEESS